MEIQKDFEEVEGVKIQTGIIENNGIVVARIYDAKKRKVERILT